MNKHLVAIVIVPFAFLGCGKEQPSDTKGNASSNEPAAYNSVHSSDPNAKVTLAPQPIAEAYHQVKDIDGIQIYGKMSAVAFTDGNLQIDNFQCNFINDTGKISAMSLNTSNVKQGLIETRDFGVIIITNMDPSGSCMFFAKDSQIKKLRSIHPSLYSAIRDKNVDSFNMLLKENPDMINNKDYFGFSPLDLAAKLGYEDITRILIANKADVNANDRPLNFAIAGRHKAIIDLFLANGAEVNGTNDDGATPLHIAASWGYAEIVETILAHGGRVNAKENDGGTPLYLAAQNGYKDVVALLLTNGADVNAADINDRTPLHRAVKNGYKELTELLLANGANINAGDINGERPLNEAVEYGFEDIVELLLSKGASVSAYGSRNSPLTDALSYGRTNIAEMLRQHGAHE